MFEMLFTMTLIVSLVFSIIELRGVSSRISRLFFFISTGLVFVMVAFNRASPDYNGYSGSFYNGNANLEIGYRLFSYLLKSIHLPFETILFLMGALIWGVLLLAARTQYSNLIVFYYLLFPLAYDLTQIRNTLMYLLVVLALILYGHRNRIVFLISVLIAASLHALGILYAPFVFLIKKSRRDFFKWLKIIFVILAIGAIGLRVSMLFIHYPNAISEEIDPFEWFYFVIQIVYLAIDAFTIIWIDQKIGNKLSADEQPVMENLFRFGMYSMLYLPLVSLSSEMYRFRRNAQIIKYFFSAMALKYLSRKDKAILIGLIMLNLLFAVGMIFYTGDQVIFSSFENNLFVRLFS